MRIAILGSAPSSRLLAPFHDQSWEVWACSPQNYDLPRVDAWFELHSLDRKFRSAPDVYTTALQRHPRVYIAAPDPRLPEGIVFDPVPLIEKYGPYFWTSSMAWMMAFALEQKPDQIGLFGVDMSATSEYEYQRPGIHYFMQMATNAGIEIVVPPQSDIAQAHPLYGFKEQWPMYWKMKAWREEMEQRRLKALEQEKASEHERHYLEGAQAAEDYISKMWLHGAQPHFAGD